MASHNHQLSHTPEGRAHLMDNEAAGELPLPDTAAVLTAPEGTILAATEQAADLAGLARPDDLVGCRLTDLLVSDESGSWLHTAQAVTRVRTLSWPHGQDERARVTVFVDVSDVPTTTGAPHTEEELRLAQVHQAARMGVWQWDQTDNTAHVSEVLQELTGWPSTVQTPFERYMASVHPEDRERVRRTWAPLLDNQHPIEVEHRYVLADGAIRQFLVHGSTARDDSGKLILVGTMHDVTQYRDTEQHREYWATHDDLTGLPNRAALHHTLDRVLCRGDTDIAVLACNIDNFTRITTAQGGPEVGEQVLTTVAHHLYDNLPSQCTVTRESDAQFVIVCSDVSDIGGLESLTRRVSGLLSTTVHIQHQPIQVSGSIGVAIQQGNGGRGEDLLRFAHAALDQAKRNGISQVALANRELMTSVDQQLNLEAQLRAAIHHEGLTLHYQPIVRADRSPHAAEALVRWPHPEHGLLSPATFLPVAERAGLLLELDHWVLRTALAQAATWPPSRDEPLLVGINLAALTPDDPDFDDILTDAIAAAGIDPHRVVLELLETALLDLSSRAQATMQRLGSRGVRFAIDDFGTGYSTLSRVKALPVDTLKIAREFVAGIEDHDPVDLAVARALVDVSHAMGRGCVAEGVETTTQLQTLSALGVDYYQGWLFAPALPADQFHDLLAHDHALPL